MFVFRIVLGIITKKNILEHLEELKQHTEPLVTSPQPFHTRDHRTRTLWQTFRGMNETWCERLLTVPGSAT